jgi:hypothetical protein
MNAESIRKEDRFLHLHENRTVIQQLFTCATSEDRFYRSRLLSVDILIQILEENLCFRGDIDLDCFEPRLYPMMQRLRLYRGAFEDIRSHVKRTSMSFECENR